MFPDDPHSYPAGATQQHTVTLQPVKGIISRKQIFRGLADGSDLSVIFDLVILAPNICSRGTCEQSSNPCLWILINISIIINISDSVFQASNTFYMVPLLFFLFLSQFYQFLLDHP